MSVITYIVAVLQRHASLQNFAIEPNGPVLANWKLLLFIVLQQLIIYTEALACPCEVLKTTLSNHLKNIWNIKTKYSYKSQAIERKTDITMSNYNHATCNVLRTELTYHSKERNVKFASLKKTSN